MVLFLFAAFALQNAIADGLEYNRDVRPILSENCFACHGFDKAKREAGLRLDTAEGAIEKLDSGGVAIQPGKPDESALVLRILATDDSVMPPHESGKKLTDHQKGILKSWVAQGARYDKHWAFIAPKKNPQPKSTLSNGDATTNPIDNFILAKLESEKLAPSPPADPITLIRRLNLDLTGLPPTVSDVDAFVEAFQQNPELARRDLVDRLLRSPNYGERWGRWWLDQARYADSNGYSVDAPRQIWKYRDWVIDALNRDMSFDQFTIEQLAGDLLPDATDEQRVATGFHRNTQINQEGGIDQEQFRIDSVFDRVATTGTVWLGLTIGCAQCHDHKFDPIEQKEYYRFFAFFNNQDEPELTLYKPELKAPSLIAEQKELEAATRDIVSSAAEAISKWEESLAEEQKKSLSKEIQKLLSSDKAKRNAGQMRGLYDAGLGATDEKFQDIQKRLKEIGKLLAEGVSTMVMKERPTPRKTNLFIQGDFTRPADEVTCGTPSILPPLETNANKINRLDLAKWIAAPSNPLTSRVIVNRVWQHYFGRGLVETENDFGLQGTSPSHPELLDWLAVQFVEQGWSLKELHRLIVHSKTYQQSSADRADLREKDRGNYWLAKQRRLRLDGEIVRDVELAACGLLSPKLGGPPVYPPIPDGVMSRGQVKREWKVSKGEDRYRRGLYTFVYRATPPPSLNVFDAPDGYSTCTRRPRSNTPLQALTLMNDAGFFEFAGALEKIIQTEGIVVAFRRCVARPPTTEEVAILQGLDSLSAARALLNLDETVTRE
ncbi:MAG: PSD1 and planctomycete cytochrome C domain-containing protein [Planctomycetota bacterium]|nr:PSD1 and planctomycete cytochrome C domain-containing protein [Planctomycetota bacterium]